MSSKSAEKRGNTVHSSLAATPAAGIETAVQRRNRVRREKIAARETLDVAQHRALSQALEQHLAPLLARCAPRVLGFCWPFRAEFDARPLVTRLLAASVRACLPVVVGTDAALDFRAWQPGSTLAVDRYGIHYPVQGERLRPDVLLLPVNAFDAMGYRLGYGAGYFDRTLAALQPPPLALGIGFELARVASIEAEAHDVPLDAVVTEAGVEIFSPRLRTLLQGSAEIRGPVTEISRNPAGE